MTLRLATLAIALFAAGTILAAPSGNARAGKAKAAPCAACHGDGNKTLDATYPKLAGQYPDYMAKALHDYKSGKRSNPIMGAQAANLSDQDIADLAEYFGSVPGGIHDLSGHAR
ncbi:MAG: c-type cytochrome [Pseudoxanthomonas sp.]